MAHAKRQHYVPRFLLEHFTKRGSDQVFVFDKQAGKSFPTNISNAAVENGFYDVTFVDTLITIEPSLATVEGDAAKVVKQLVECPNLFLVSDADKVKMASFIALQMVRGPSHRALLKQSAEGMLQAAKKFFPGKPIVESDYLPTEDQQRLMAIKSIEESPRYVPALLDKTWLLFKVKSGRPFYTSDNPVVLGNSQAKREGLFSGIGLFCRGIEIYIPLSRDLILALFCRSYEEGWTLSEAKARILKEHDAYQIPDSMKRTEELFERCMLAVRKKRPIEIDDDLLAHQNSMQVVAAERFLFSAVDDFALARERIEKFPELKFGRKLITSV